MKVWLGNYMLPDDLAQVWEYRTGLTVVGPFKDILVMFIWLFFFLMAIVLSLGLEIRLSESETLIWRRL